MDWQGIAAVVSAFGVIVLGVLVPVINSSLKRKEKETELRLQRIEKEDKVKHENEKALLSEIYSRLYGYMWKLLLSVDADRVFIIQPHPLADKQFISVSLEIVHPDRDVKAHKENFQFKKMSEWAGLVAKLGTEDWMIYRDISEIKDVKVYNEAHRRGVKALVFRKMVDERGYWEGTLCVEYTHNHPEGLDQIKGEMTKKARLIEDILPEYKLVEKTNI